MAIGNCCWFVRKDEICYFGKVKNFFAILVLALLWVVPSVAKVIEDSNRRFVLEDLVLESSVHKCSAPEDKGGVFMPEDAAYLDGNQVPFRYYRIALPSKEKPSVSVTDAVTLPLGKPLCKSTSNEVLQLLPLEISEPYLKDGLWMTDIRVPLYVKNGTSVSLRKKFRLHVDYNASASGVNPGKRALSRVENSKAAARFGVSRAKAIKSLRKAASDPATGVTFLAQLKVGDKNIATFNEDGLYALDFKSIRTSLLLWQRQFELDGIPVDRICVFGASPDTLSDAGPGEAERSPNHIAEIPIEIRDHSPGSLTPDGIFDDGDTVVFVGYGNGFWKRFDREDSFFVNGKMDYFHSYSPYSYYQYFLFGFKDSGKGLRFSDRVAAPAGKGKDITWMRYARAEKDAILRDTYFGKLLDWESKTGKEWFWLWHERDDSTWIAPSVLNMEETSRLPGLVPGGRQYVAVSYFPHRSVHNDKSVKQISDVKLSGESYLTRMKNIHFSFDVNGNSVLYSDMDLMPVGNYRLDNPGLLESNNQYSLTMLKNSRQPERFNGYSVAYQWNPSDENAVGAAEWLLPGAVSGIINIPVPSGVMVMKFKDLLPVGLLSSANGVLKDSVAANEDVRYLVVRENRFRSALQVEGIPVESNGVLKDLSRPNSKTEYLIIAPYAFLEPAKALAEFRSDGSAVTNIATTVVSVEDIYRRYTAGRMSPVAIRNYIAYVYSVCPNLRYVLLAGAGHFDYRDMNGKFGPIYIPPFEKENAVSEDFFGILDSAEQALYGQYDLDVAVGRLPVSSVVEFMNYVDKVKGYEKLGVMDNSDWRSTIMLAADDARNSGARDDILHTDSQETVAWMIDSLSIEQEHRWTLKKIYLLNYAEDAAGQKKDAADDFLNVLNQGALFTTYFGHGSKTDWASEGLLKPSYVSRLSNKGRYTILGSFSCTVGRFDDGGERSLSEVFLFASGVGSIASVGATRESFATYNVFFGRNLVKKSLSESGIKLGDAYLSVKRNVAKDYNAQRFNNERYVLLGEPVLKMPEFGLKMSLDQNLDSIMAMDKMTLSGSVQGMDDGYLDLVLREGRYSKILDTQIDGKQISVPYDGNMIYSEKVPVKGGRFKTEFVTPRKISIGDTSAEFSAWTYSSKLPVAGSMWKRGITIKGVSSYADSLQDTVPPTIQIQSCYSGAVASSFSDAQTVRMQLPACLQVVVEDSTAIDFREQADEGISFEVVGVKDPFHPWPFVEQSSKKAKARMTFNPEQYPAGHYAFKVRAMDVLGNVSIKTLNLDLTDDMEVGLIDVFNAPNPVGKKGTTFYFKNLAGDRASRVNIFIYNQNGKLVKVIKDAVSGETHWNGRDNHGRPLANGLYHYVVRSDVPASENFGAKTWTKKQKLLISR